MSGLHRYDAKRDANESEITGYLDDLLIPWWQLSGEGVPDLLVLHNGDFKLIEVKGRLGRLNGAQRKFFGQARDGNAKHLFVVRDLESLLSALEGEGNEK